MYAASEDNPFGMFIGGIFTRANVLSAFCLTRLLFQFFDGCLGGRAFVLPRVRRPFLSRLATSAINCERSRAFRRFGVSRLVIAPR
jgi:hypothetical protein